MTATSPINVLIGTPTAAGIVKVQYTHTVANTVLDLTKHGMGADYLTFDGPDNAIGRNYIASHMMEKGHSHLFFIDSDMWFDGSLCRRMISLQKRLLGCVYAKRKLDFRRLERNLGQTGHNFDNALALAFDYNVLLPEDGFHVENGLCKVHGFGLGAALIQRQTFQEMIDKGVSRQQPGGAALGLDDYYDFFVHVADGNGEMMGEDYSFCHKWREGCGGDVWALIDADVRHVGDIAYGVPFLKRVNAASAMARAGDGPKYG